MSRIIPVKRVRVFDLTSQSVLIIILAIGTLYFLFQTWLSLDWYSAHDSSYLHTILFLIDRYGLVPYRDIFEPSLPLTYMFHLAIGKTLGWGDPAFRAVDVAYLGALLFVTWRIMRPLGGLVAWAAALSFGLLYQSYGPTMSLQRDFLCLLPAAIAIWVAGDVALFGRRRWRYLALGALFGLAAAIKPHFPIGLLPVLVYAAFADGRLRAGRRSIDRRELIALAALASAGLALALALPLLWLWQRNALGAFWEIAVHYLPLYRQLNGNQELLSSGEKWIYVLTTAPALGGKAGLLMAAALGLYWGLVEIKLSATQRRLVILLAVMLPIYFVYELIAAKFWAYHWMPLYYFACCCGALVLLPLRDRASNRGRRVFAVVVFAIGLALTLRPAPDVYAQIQGLPPAPIAGGRADRITAFLQQNLEPGDTIQPLDGVTGGSATALRRAGAALATPYIVDYQFYHHVSSPYIQSLRRDLLSRLAAAPPRFIIDVPSPTRPQGIDTTDDFAELDAFVAAHYHVALADEGFTIYERDISTLADGD